MSKKKIPSNVIQTVNVVVIKDGIVDMIYSYDEKDNQEAEARFVQECTRLDKGISAIEIQDVLEDGYLSIMNASVCLCHSMKED